LTVANDTVLIADYKTDSAVPLDPDDVAPRYVTQLALYRAVLASIYPEKTVRAALVFTAGPLLVEIAGSAMDTAMEKVLRRGSRSLEAALTPIS
jgi:ATP-dependent helicase/nuclease subunit A